MCLQIARNTLMSGRCAALTGWPRWRWRIFWRRTTRCTTRVTTLITSIAIHGSVTRSASGKRVLRIGRTCNKRFLQILLEQTRKFQRKRVVFTRRWYGSSSLGSLLLRPRFDLINDGLRIHSPAIKMTLVCQQVLRIVLTQCISCAAARTNAQQAGYILPCFVFRHLQKKITHTRSLLRSQENNFTLNLTYTHTPTYRQKRSACPKEKEKCTIIRKILPMFHSSRY